MHVYRKIGFKDIPDINTTDEYTIREIAGITQKIPEIKGELLWAAADINKNGLKDCDYLADYLSHPSLRIPSACLLQSHSQLLRIS